MNNRTILIGDVLEKVKEIPNEIIDCIVTSPPYWGLRDYGVPGQWGLEKDFHEYLAKMQLFMNEMKRVLKPEGTVFINLGDTYSGGNTHSDFSGLPKELARLWNEGHRFKSAHKKDQIQAKSQYGIPQRFYADCIDQGWLARNFIPWVKGNAMPSSVKDRLTNVWEPIMFFTKQQHYFFNLDAIRVKTIGTTKPFNIRVQRGRTDRLDPLFKVADWEKEGAYNDKGEPKQDATLGADGKPKANYKGFNKRWADDRKGLRVDGQSPQGIHRKRHSGNYGADGEYLLNRKGRNPGDVLNMNPRPLPRSSFCNLPN